jgi:hypothetical protein
LLLKKEKRAWGPSRDFIFVYGGLLASPEPVFVNLKGAQESIPSLRTGATTIFDVQARQATKAGGIDSWLESSPRLLKSLQIRALNIPDTCITTLSDRDIPFFLD